jgi:HAD superfamily hydrolase (TIGR01490 family)
MTASTKIGAFFDLDGTVVAPPSLEWRFVGFLLARDLLGTRDIGRWLGTFAKKALLDPRSATIENKKYLAALPESLATDGERFFGNCSPFYPEALEQMNWHCNQGHRVFLISGTLDFLARSAARQLPGRPEVHATQLEVADGRWTGNVRGPHMSGQEKACAIRTLAGRFGLSLWDSYAYGNSTSDLPMLDTVGRRVAANPSARLRRIAGSEGWPAVDWKMPATPVSAHTTHLAVRAR